MTVPIKSVGAKYTYRLFLHTAMPTTKLLRPKQRLLLLYI